jgi:hypothetical protein
MWPITCRSSGIRGCARPLSNMLTMSALGCSRLRLRPSRSLSRKHAAKGERAFRNYRSDFRPLCSEK